MKEISVQVQADYLERISHVRKPVLAIVELMWNGLDANAMNVKVYFEFNKMDGLEKIYVEDDGDGIAYDDAIPAFENLGGSWKKNKNKSSKNRLLHGKAGKGRFCSFFLGNKVLWKTRYLNSNSIFEYEISGSYSNLGMFRIGDQKLSSFRSTGTIVEISGIDKNYRSLFDSNIIQEVTEYFALYLKQYNDIKIEYNDEIINPSIVEDCSVEIELARLKLDKDKIVSSKLSIIEWKHSTDRYLFLCDSNGFTLSKVPPGIQAPGFNFTAYLKSDFIRNLDSENRLILEEIDPELEKLLDLARNSMRDYFRKRTAEKAVDLVEEWKKEEIYPYKGEPVDIIEEAERQVFDICAWSVSNYLPDFDKSEKKNKQLTLGLLKQALEKNPESLQNIFENVLNLPIDKQKELSELLKRTSLSAVINASKVVADRLNFLKGLEILVFEPVSKKTLLERSQLHRILVDHTWIFGEEYNLTVDDKSLTEVLLKHINLLGRTANNLAPVLTVDGEKGIIDIMLSRIIPQPNPTRREHLIIELKAPKIKVNSDATNQIEKYAFAVSNDERFRDTDTKWTFWVVSNEITEDTRKRANQANREAGIIFMEDKLIIWVKTWGQIIQQCKARLNFFQERLQYYADTESALAYLHKTHEKYLPKSLKK